MVADALQAPDSESQPHVLAKGKQKDQDRRGIENETANEGHGGSIRWLNTNWTNGAN